MCSRSHEGETAKARLGFSSGSAGLCRAAGQAAGRELEETAAVVMPQGLGAGGGSDKREGRRSFRDAAGPPLRALSGLGDSLCSPLCPWAVLASLLNHELGSGGLGGRN